nr:hypothetical protein BaRGS_026423 [Batillaria attramentaria]
MLSDRSASDGKEKTVFFKEDLVTGGVLATAGEVEVLLFAVVVVLLAESGAEDREAELAESPELPGLGARESSSEVPEVRLLGRLVLVLVLSEGQCSRLLRPASLPEAENTALPALVLLLDPDPLPRSECDGRSECAGELPLTPAARVVTPDPASSIF